MARKSGSTAARVLEIRDWLADRLEQDPLIPATVLVTELRAAFNLGRSQAYQHLAVAQKQRQAERQAHPDWQVLQEQRRQYLLDLRGEAEQALYLAKQEGNRSAQTGLISRLLQIDEKLATVAPLESFRSQFEHQMARERIPF
jgi:hypothetical protein